MNQEIVNCKTGKKLVYDESSPTSQVKVSSTQTQNWNLEKIPDLNAYLIYDGTKAKSITSKNIGSREQTGLKIDVAVKNSPIDNCYKFYRVVTNVKKNLDFLPLASPSPSPSGRVFRNNINMRNAFSSK